MSSDVSAGETTLYERIGGKPVIEDAVGRFYDRVFADPHLAPYFRGVTLSKLRAMQVELFTAALDGPATYSEQALHDAHAGHGIGDRQVSQFLEHLLATLLEIGLEPDDADQVVHRIAMLAPEVTGEANEDG
jgi:hemoglobin